MAIDAVVASVQFAADEPLPEWWIARVERRVPVVIPIEQIGVSAKTFGEIFFVELRDERRIVQIRLSDKFRGREEEILFLPVNCDLRFVFFGERRVFCWSLRAWRICCRVFGRLHHRLFFVRICSSLRLRFRFFLGRLGHDEAPFEFCIRHFQPKDDATARHTPSTNVIVPHRISRTC